MTLSVSLLSIRDKKPSDDRVMLARHKSNRSEKMKTRGARLRNLFVEKNRARRVRLHSLRVEEIHTGGAHLCSLHFGCDVRSGHLRDVSLQPGALGCLGLLQLQPACKTSRQPQYIHVYRA